MRWNELSEQRCPIARGLSVIGDRWTLLVLREAFRGVRRFDQFQQRLGITRHVLADRLRQLEAGGVLRRELYQERPQRWEYRLTKRGIDLYPVLLTLASWADRNLPHAEGPSVRYFSKTTGTELSPVLTDGGSGLPITARDIRAVFAEDS